MTFNFDYIKKINSRSWMFSSAKIGLAHTSLAHVIFKLAVCCISNKLVTRCTITKLNVTFEELYSLQVYASRSALFLNLGCLLNPGTNPIPFISPLIYQSCSHITPSGRTRICDKSIPVLFAFFTYMSVLGNPVLINPGFTDPFTSLRII